MTNEYQRIEYTPYGETWVEKTQNTGLEWLPYKFTAKEMDEETGLYYYGARYLDPKYSRWLSTGPALGEYVPSAGKGTEKEAGNLPGMCGVFNTVNGNLYHYAGNNPVKYTDPDGREDEEVPAFNLITPLLQKNTDTVEGPKNKLAEVRFGVATVVGDKYSDMVPSSAWGNRPSLDTKEGKTKEGHNGMDFAAKTGTRVNAVMDGVVEFVDAEGKDNSGYGKYTVIKHSNGTYSLYGHQNSVEVKKGDSVVAGQMIGTVGSTGMSTGPHLHFGFDGNGDGKFSREKSVDDPARLLYSGLGF